MNSARYFIRREDDEAPHSPRESSFRCFDVKCLKCGPYRLTPTSGFDDDAGEMRVTLAVSRCRPRETLKLR